VLENGQHLTIFHFEYILTIIINAFGHMCTYCAVDEILTAQVNSYSVIVFFYVQLQIIIDSFFKLIFIINIIQYIYMYVYIIYIYIYLFI